MKILLLNQCFHPDSAATAQHATDLARAFVESGGEVTVLAGRRAYGRPEVRYPAEEEWEGVRVVRAGAVELGKGSRRRRAVSFASFAVACAWRLVRMPRFDVVIAMTSPPLISFLGALFTRVKGGELHLWVMDLNPDEAVAAGWLREGSLVTRMLEWINRWSLRQASRVVVMDRFMKQRVKQKVARRRRTQVDADSQIHVVPPGSRDHLVRYDPDGRREFRQAHGLTGKFVVMYSGNHSPCHPLDTLLASALLLRDDPSFGFGCVGGGSQFEKVRGFANTSRLDNIVTLPYQPIESLPASLSAADLHAVVMGDPFVGIVHPSKIYNALALGIPVLYIGPAESHITDLAPREAEEEWFFPARHSEVDRVVAHILAAENSAGQGHPGELAVAARFRHNSLMAELTAAFLGEEMKVKTAGAF